MHLETTLSTLTAADKRIRHMGNVMFELRANGSCTDSLLFAEGFSQHELVTFGDAARKWAEQRRVRRVDLPGAEGEPAGFTRNDDELIDIALREAAGLVADEAIAEALLQKGFSAGTVRRIWKRFSIKLAAFVATQPCPSFELVGHA